MIGNQDRLALWLQPRRIEQLRKQPALTYEQHVARWRKHASRVGVEQAPGVQTVQAAHIHAPGVGVARDEEEKMPTVGEERRERLASLSRRLESRHRRGRRT